MTTVAAQPQKVKLSAEHPAISDAQIAALAPSLFSARNYAASTDELIRRKFLETYKPFRDQGMNSFDLARIASALFYYRPMLAEILHPAKNEVAVEIGSGWGLKALAWADLFASYVGIEITPHATDTSQFYFRERGVKNARTVTGNAEAVLQHPEKYGIDQVDVLILYAVLEHLTLPERKSILQLAQEVYLAGGAVLIAESPNRLSPSDAHSFQLPFVEWLPVELLSEYVHKSPREDLKELLSQASPEKRHETLYRLGRGISFHEFECFWDRLPLESARLANDGYSPELLNLEPYRREEWQLLNFLADNGLDIHRMFTRYWIEGIFSAQGGAPSQKSAIYLPPVQTSAGPPWRGRGVAHLDEMILTANTEDILEVVKSATEPRDVILLLDAERSFGTLQIEGGTTLKTSELDLASIRKCRLPAWHTRSAVPLGRVASEPMRLQVAGPYGQLASQGILLV
jgi:Methyltransferase domain